MSAVSMLVFWNEERSWSVQSISTIVEPKKKYGEVFNAGEEISARFKGSSYPGTIIKISDNRTTLKEAGLKLEEILKESECLETNQIIERLKNMDTCTLEEFRNKQKQNGAEKKKNGAEKKKTELASPSGSLDVDGERIVPLCEESVVASPVTPSKESNKDTPCTTVKAGTSGSSSTDQSSANISQAAPEQEIGLSSSPFFQKSRPSEKRKYTVDEEINFLKSDLRKLRKRVAALESKSDSSSKVLKDSAEEEKKSTDRANPNKELNILLENVSDINCAISTALYHLFTKEEIVNCSVTGKRSVKSGDRPRQGFHQEKLSMLETALKTKFSSMTHKYLVEKIQNIQKVERRRMKFIK